MSRLDVVQIITSLDVGGAERVVLDLSSRLIDAGAAVTIVWIGGRGEILTHGYDERIQFVSLGISWNPLHIARAIGTFSRVVFGRRPSVIHAHMFHALILALIWQRVQRNASIVFTSHSALVPPFRRLVIRLTRRFRSCDVVFSAAQHSSINASEYAVIPNGTRVAMRDVRLRLPATGQPWIIVSVGRLQGVKAPVELIEQFSQLTRTDVELWLVGDGDLRKKVEATIERLQLGNRVRLLGMRLNVAEVLDQAHLFAMASRREGMPVAILEAGARGVPVLATPVGSIPELLADDAGYLAEQKDFAVTIEAIIGHYDEALRRAVRLQQKVCSMYSMEVMTRAHLRIYRSVTASASSGAG